MQMVFAKDSDMIGTFATNAPIQSLSIQILPGTVIGSQHLFDVHRFNALSKPISMDTISIPKQISGRGVPRERLNTLLRGSFGRGMRSHIEVNDPTPEVTQDHKHEQHPKSNCPHDEKIYTNHVRHVILDGGSPGLRWWFRRASMQESGHASLG